MTATSPPSSRLLPLPMPRQSSSAVRRRRGRGSATRGPAPAPRQQRRKRFVDLVRAGRMGPRLERTAAPCAGRARPARSAGAYAADPRSRRLPARLRAAGTGGHLSHSRPAGQGRADTAACRATGPGHRRQPAPDGFAVLAEPGVCADRRRMREQALAELDGAGRARTDGQGQARSACDRGQAARRRSDRAGDGLGLGLGLGRRQGSRGAASGRGPAWRRRRIAAGGAAAGDSIEQRRPDCWCRPGAGLIS